MFEPTDEEFRKKIRENPRDALARGIYADWLYEQGNADADFINLFPKLAMDEDNVSWLFETRFGKIWDVLAGLNQEQRIQAAVNFCWAVPEVRRSQASIELLRDIWLFSLGTITESQVDSQSSVYLQISSNAGYFPFIYALTVALNDQYIAFGAYDAVRHHQASINPSTYNPVHRQVSDRLYVIAISYRLFGVNVLTDSFENSGNI